MSLFFIGRHLLQDGQIRQKDMSCGDFGLKSTQVDAYERDGGCCEPDEFAISVVDEERAGIWGEYGL